MTKSLKEFTETVEAEAVEEAYRKKVTPYPSGWEPGVAWDGNTGTLVSRPTEDVHPEYNELLRSWGFDPEVYEIDGSLAFRTWEAQTPQGIQQLYSHRANIRKRASSDAVERRLDVEELIQEIKRYKPGKRVHPSGDEAFVVCLADWQVGKVDGDGTTGIVQRILDSKLSIKNRYNELRKMGRKIGSLYVVGMGDMVEACDNFYPGQPFMVELNNRDQAKVARRLVRDLIKEWAADFETVVVTAVPGNHGEVRTNGKRATDDGDNTDVALFESVAEVLAENPAFSHVKFVLPNDEMVVTLDVAGTTVSFTHSHKAERSSGVGLPQAKVKTWWKDQTFCGQPVGDAHVLVTGHFHSFSAIEYTDGRLHLQCPSQESCSKWWMDSKGETSTPGTLTFVSGGENVRDIQVV